ncbi:MAG: hypothetical protein KAT38_11255, partial [Bacteroidales bacterium]|nr:hypothetical protein [Bacteroidales bacterium]
MKKYLLVILPLFFITTTSGLTTTQDSIKTIQTEDQQLSDSVADEVILPQLTKGSGLLESETNQVVPVKPSFEFNLLTMLRGMFGLLVIIAIAFAFSTNRKAVSWRVVVTGLAIQVVLAAGILYVPVIRLIFEFVGKIFVKILDFTKVGSEFLFGEFLDLDKYGMIFAFQILPTIIFFSALTSVLFYYGIIQKIVYGLAWVMTK